jgi:hypothetical protein
MSLLSHSSSSPFTTPSPGALNKVRAALSVLVCDVADDSHKTKKKNKKNGFFFFFFGSQKGFASSTGILLASMGVLDPDDDE